MLPVTAENMDVVKKGVAKDWQHLFATSTMRSVGVHVPIRRPYE